MEARQRTLDRLGRAGNHERCAAAVDSQWIGGHCRIHHGDASLREFVCNGRGFGRHAARLIDHQLARRQTLRKSTRSKQKLPYVGAERQAKQYDVAFARE
jgi:hypothetical protein